jgi:hypothetical protein
MLEGEKMCCADTEHLEVLLSDGRERRFRK